MRVFDPGAVHASTLAVHVEPSRQPEKFWRIGRSTWSAVTHGPIILTASRIIDSGVAMWFVF